LSKSKPKPKPQLARLDGSVADVAKMLGVSRATILRRLKDKLYESYLDAGGTRRIILASVHAARDRAIAENAVEPMAPGPGRPRQDDQPAAE
jgi:AcrR family transcriptional regulator